MNIAWVSSSPPHLPSTGGFSLIGGNLIPLLARRHRIDLVSLTRPGDEKHLEWARRHCASVQSIPVGRPSLSRRVANFASCHLWGRNLLARDAMENALRAGLDDRRWDILHVEGGMVAGLIPEKFPLPKVLAVHDAEVLRARELRRCKLPWRARLNYLARGWHEPRYERLVYPRFDQCVMVAERDAAFNRELIPQARFCSIPNGIDCNYFCPVEVRKEPAGMVFHGNLAYAPNVEAACEFAERILPLLRRDHPDATFHMVGATPESRVRDLSSRPGIRLSANLPDLRSALCAASVYVCPLQHGSGMKNKILEAMASQLPIVCYEGAIAGIDCTPGQHVVVARGPADFAAKVSTLLRFPERAAQTARMGRAFVIENYSWEVSAAAYEQIYARLAIRRQAAAEVCVGTHLGQ